MKKTLAILLVSIQGCGDQGVGNRTRPAESGWTLNLEPASDLDKAQPVTTFVVENSPSGDAPVDVVLVEGEPSKVSLGKYEEGVSTEVLLERIVPTRIEERATGVALRPVFGLALGQRYTVISRAGILGSISINPDSEFQYLSRVWPPRDSVEPTQQVLFCGPAAPVELAEVQLFPSSFSARLQPGFDTAGHGQGSCVRILPTLHDGSSVQPPASWGEFAFEPTPFKPGASLPEIQPLVCDDGETTIGPGCISTSKGAAVVRTPASSTFWVIASSQGWHMQAVEGGGRIALSTSGFVGPESIDVVVFDLAGRTFSGQSVLLPPTPAARVVINEVMANPLGPEPAEEWIELLNAGTLPAEIVGWKLQDQSGDVDIPPLILEPSAMVLLVRRDFEGGRAGDVPPASGTTLVRLPSLGKNGLSNSGEAIALLDASGAVVSTFPGRTSSREGVSLARIDPAALDDAVDGFAPHAGRGASPGAPNTVE